MNSDPTGYTTMVETVKATRLQLILHQIVGLNPGYLFALLSAAVALVGLVNSGINILEIMLQGVSNIAEAIKKIAAADEEELISSLNDSVAKAKSNNKTPTSPSQWHHIVARRNPLHYRARQKINGVGILIDGPENTIWINSKLHWHLYTLAYYASVVNAVAVAPNTYEGCARTLNAIGDIIYAFSAMLR